MNLSEFLVPILLSIAIPVVGGNQLMAQDINENDFTRYTKQQGLSHNIITGVLQDSTGYIWVATPSGLNRFNGSGFVQFHSTKDSVSLPAEYLRGLVWLDRSRLAAYPGGLHIINTRTGETRNLFIPYPDKKYQYKFNDIMSVNSGPAGDILVLARSGFYHFDKNFRLVYRFDYYAKEAIPIEHFGFGGYTIWLDKQRLMIIAVDGMYCYDIAKKLFKKMAPADCPLLAEFLDDPKKEYLFLQEKPGSLFIVKKASDSLVYLNIAQQKRTAVRLPFAKGRREFDYRSGLFAVSDTVLYITGRMSGFYRIRLHPPTGAITFYPPKYFPFYYCRNLMEDREHHLWIATNKGLFRENKSRLHIRQTAVSAQLEALFPGTVMGDICVAGARVYVATRASGGILVFDKEGLRFIRQISFEKCTRSPRAILSIVAANDTTLFVGSNGPLFRLNTQTGTITEVMLDKFNRATDWIADLYKDRKGNIWIASENVYRYDAATHKFTIVPTGRAPFDKLRQPMGIKEDAAGNIWLSGHGLLRFNTRSGNCDRFVDSFPAVKMPDRQVSAFIADGQNNLWINSHNNGLSCYNINSGTFRHFTRENGLPDNNIADMMVIGNKLWIASLSGIACLDLHTSRITSFGKEDGFPDEPIVTGANFFYDTALNKLYISFTNTIVEFDPGIISQKVENPYLFIESLTTGNQEKWLFPPKNITTSWRNNEITVTIGSINFLSGNSQRFAYRLVRDDSVNWQQLGTQNTFSVSNLSPGYHRIQVKLFSPSNRWPAQAKEIDITILPPFWEQIWFLAVLAVMLLLAVYLLLRWRTGRIRKKEQEKTHIQQLKAEEYKNQFELEHISNYFSSSLAGKKNVEEILWDVTKNLIGRIGYVDCIIYLWNGDKSRMVQKAAYGPKGDPDTIAKLAFDVSPGQGVVGHVMHTKEPLLIPDTRKDHRYRIDDMVRLSEICVPIIHNNELIGIIDSEHHSENYFKDRDIKILTTIATLVGNKIKQIESEQSLEIKQKEIASINQQLAEAQLSALQTQMNPHFIFNSLNSIKGMILDNEQQKASRYLSKFAHIIRITLNQSKEIFTTLYENTEHLETYLVMEKLRFDDSFAFQVIVDDYIDKEEMLIPSLMIQPLAENAIWHGLMHKKGEKQLSIRFSRQAQTISCIVEDNGIGIKRSEQLKRLNRPTHQSVGLNNLRNRIKIMNEKYNTGCTLDITDLNEFNKRKTGTRAVLCFNVITNKPYV